jgi:two-component system C4-dicarboxylate transport response regulator DctD
MTSGETFTIALIDDDDDLRTATEQLLVIAGYVVQTFASALEARDAIGPDFAGVVISDVRMPQMSGVELFHILHGRDPDLPVMLISGHADVQMAVDALKSGVWDFIEKPLLPMPCWRRSGVPSPRGGSALKTALCAAPRRPATRRSLWAKRT